MQPALVQLRLSTRRPRLTRRGRSSPLSSALACGFRVQPALAQLRIPTRWPRLTRRGCSSPSPSALAWLPACLVGFVVTARSSLSPLASARLLRAAVIGLVLLPMHAGLAPPDCMLIAVAAGFDLSPACDQRRLVSALPARRSCFARFRAHRRCRWPRRGFCVQPASARHFAIRTLDSLRSPAGSPPSPLVSARPSRAAGASPVLRHWLAGLASLARLLLAVAVGAGLSLARSRHQLGLHLLRAGLALLACMLAAAATGFGVASACSWYWLGTAPLRAGLALAACVLIALAVGFGVTSSCIRRRLGSACYLRAGLARLLARSPSSLPASTWLLLACIRRRLGAAPLACLSCSARPRARRRRRWLRRGFCVQPAPALRFAACMLALLVCVFAAVAIGFGATSACIQRQLSAVRLRAGPALLVCMLAAVAVGFGVASACIPVGSIPRTRTSCPARAAVCRCDGRDCTRTDGAPWRRRRWPRSAVSCSARQLPWLRRWAGSARMPPLSSGPAPSHGAPCIWLTAPASRHPPHGTRLTAPASRHPPHGARSRLLPHGICLTAPASRHPPHGLRLTAPASRHRLIHGTRRSAPAC